MKVLLLLVGIILLVAGTWVQDLSPTSDAITATYNASTFSAPSWHDPHVGILEPVRRTIATGLLLKLGGLGLLFSLFFWRLHQAKAQRNSKIAMQAFLGLGSAVCLGTFAVLAPAARSVEHIMQVMNSYFYPYQYSAGFQDILSAVAASGRSAVTGWVFLAAGLVLLAGAVFADRRRLTGMLSVTCVSPVVFCLFQGRSVFRDSPTWCEFLLWGNGLSVAALIFLAACPVLIMCVILAGKKRQLITSLLTKILLPALGCLTLAAWAFSISNVSGLKHALATADTLNKSVVAESAQLVVSPVYFLSFTLLAYVVIVPVFCALSFTSANDKSKPVKGTPVFSLPLICLVLIIVFFGSAAYTGLRRNPYKDSLWRVSLELPYGKLEKVRDDVNRLESEEGLRYLSRLVNAPQEFYWHDYVMEYLWNNSRNPKTSDLVLDMLCDETRPVPAAVAYFIVLNDMEESHAWRKILSYLSRNPSHAGIFIEMDIHRSRFESARVFEIMKTCSDAGVSEFSFHREISAGRDWNEHFDLVEGIKFTLHYGHKSESNCRKLTVQLLQRKPNSEDPTPPPYHRNVVLLVDGRKVGYLCECQTVIPLYHEVTQAILRVKEELKHSPESGRLWVELQVDPVVFIHHIRLILNACARADVTEVSINEP